MATWQGIHSFSSSEVLTAANSNKYISDNVEYLLNSRAYDYSVYDPGGDVNITGAGFSSFADIDATNLSLTFTPQSPRAVVQIQLYFYRITGSSRFYLDWSNGAGTRAGNTTDGLFSSLAVNTTSTDPMNATILGVFEALTPGVTYTFKLQAKLANTGDSIRYGRVNKPLVLFGKEF